MSYMETYREWCTNPYFSKETRAELEAIRDNEAEIEDRFYRQLEFGTGGLRGVIGAGTNRMNIYTVRQATQGLANYIISQNGQEKAVSYTHLMCIRDSLHPDQDWYIRGFLPYAHFLLPGSVSYTHLLIF